MADGSVTLLPPTLSAAAQQHANFHEGGAAALTLQPFTLSGSLQGPSELPAFTLSAAGVSGQAAEGDVFLPGATVNGVSFVGTTGRGAATLPGFELFASTGTKGEAVLPRLTIFATGLAGNTSKGRNRVVAGATIHETQPTLAGFTLSATMLSQQAITGSITMEQASVAGAGIGGLTGAADFSLRAPTMIATGIAGGAWAGAANLPAPTLSATTADGAVAAGSLSLPAFTAAATAPQQPQPRTGDGDSTIDALTLSATMLPGGIATGASVLREFSIEAQVGSSPIINGALTLSEFTLEAGGLASNAAIGTVRIDELSLAAAGLSGNVGAAVVELPLVQLSAADGVLFVLGTATITLPLFSLSGVMLSAAQLADIEFVGIALNTRTRAVSTYADLAPTSAAMFNGVTLMTTADGIVALAGDTDLGDPVAAHLTSGKTDLGLPGMKRVLTGYVGYRASGDMELTMIADDHHENAYTLSPRRVEDQQHASRVKFGRGAAGVYWQFKAANVDGADFAIDRLELLTASTGAKV